VFSNNIYEVDKTVLTSIMRKGALDRKLIVVYDDNDLLIRPNVSDMKKIGEVKSLPKKHLQTFKLEDYK
jgi:hypothetical protein